MKPLLNILRKELKELATPATFIPVIVIAILFASLGGLMGGVTDDLTEKPTIGIVDQDNSQFSAIVEESLIENSNVIDLSGATDLNGML